MLFTMWAMVVFTFLMPSKETDEMERVKYKNQAKKSYYYLNLRRIAEYCVYQVVAHCRSYRSARKLADCSDPNRFVEFCTRLNSLFGPVIRITGRQIESKLSSIKHSHTMEI